MGRLSAGYGDFAGRTWLNTAHQGAMPLACAEAAIAAINWKTNPSELTQQRFSDVPQRVRDALAALVNAPAADIILANSASYGLHLIANAYPWSPGDEVVVVDGDFPSDILPWLSLEQRLGVRVNRLAPRRHVPSPDELAAGLTPRTRLFCTSWVHSFSGFVADLDGLAEVCRAHDVSFVVNGSQAVGARPFNATTSTVDALISVGFKWLCGPYGTGFLWVRPTLRSILRPVKSYWLAQLTQADLARPDLRVEMSASGTGRDFDIFGTANFNAYVPWAVALEHLLDVGIDRIHAHDQSLVDRFADGIAAAGATFLGPAEPSDRSTLAYFTAVDRERNAELHERLGAAGVDVAARAGQLRASPHLYNDEQDIDRLLDVIRHTLSYRESRT